MALGRRLAAAFAGGRRGGMRPAGTGAVAAPPRACGCCSSKRTRRRRAQRARALLALKVMAGLLRAPPGLAAPTTPEELGRRQAGHGGAPLRGRVGARPADGRGAGAWGDGADGQ
eukprot:5376209-Lingulodinium_polyedra.AAC.1